MPEVERLNALAVTLADEPDRMPVHHRIFNRNPRNGRVQQRFEEVSRAPHQFPALEVLLLPDVETQHAGIAEKRARWVSYQKIPRAARDDIEQV